MSVRGFNFTPGKTETIYFVQALTTFVTTAVVGSDGRFRADITVPPVALPGSATIRVTGSNGIFNKGFIVPPLLGSC